MITSTKKAVTVSASLILIGSIAMIIGAALLQISGADLDTALASGDLAGYLQMAGEAKGILVANLTIWIFGVLFISAGAILLTRIAGQKPILARLARYSYQTAIPIVVTAYGAWLAVVVVLGGNSSENAALLAEVVGWFASRTDWIATILVLGIGPLLLASSGTKMWAPKWLLVWSYVAVFAGCLNFLAMFTNAMTTIGFIIIPVGMSWMIALSIVLFKFAKKQTDV